MRAGPKHRKCKLPPWCRVADLLIQLQRLLLLNRCRHVSSRGILPLIQADDQTDTRLLMPISSLWRAQNQLQILHTPVSNKPLHVPTSTVVCVMLMVTTSHYCTCRLKVPSHALVISSNDYPSLAWHSSNEEGEEEAITSSSHMRLRFDEESSTISSLNSQLVNSNECRDVILAGNWVTKYHPCAVMCRHVAVHAAVAGYFVQ